MFVKCEKAYVDRFLCFETSQWLLDWFKGMMGKDLTYYEFIFFSDWLKFSLHVD